MHETWYSFLLNQSAVIEEGLVTGFANEATGNSGAENYLCDLSQLDVLRISGGDASDFLHGQFTSDVAALAQDHYQLSSWCNIKGRVIAVFILYRASDCFYLLLEREMTEQVSKRLGMFVLRSDVKIELVSDELVRLGLGGDEAHRDFQSQLQAARDNEPGIVLNLEDQPARSLVLCTAAQAEALWLELSQGAQAVSSVRWLEQDIHAGLPWPGKQGSEEFLPQSLNLDLLDGLSYSKGCYPGQEIISRMHFRGKLKQRMQLARVAGDTLPQIGTHVYTLESDKQCGSVVRACETGEKQYLMLLTLDIFEDASPDIFLGDKQGPEVELLDLPYEVSAGK